MLPNTHLKMVYPCFGINRHVTYVLQNLETKISVTYSLSVKILTKHDAYKAMGAIPYLNEGFKT